MIMSDINAGKGCAQWICTYLLKRVFSRYGGFSANHKLRSLLCSYEDDLWISSRTGLWGEISGVSPDGHIYPQVSKGVDGEEGVFIWGERMSNVHRQISTSWFGGVSRLIWSKRGFLQRSEGEEMMMTRLAWCLRWETTSQPLSHV